MTSPEVEKPEVDENDTAPAGDNGPNGTGQATEPQPAPAPGHAS